MTSGSASPHAAPLSAPRASGSSPPVANAGSALSGAAIVAAIAVVVRFCTLTVQSFWLDEAYTEHLVHLGFGSMLSSIPKSESTPPLYYVIAWGWTHLFGYSEFALRSVSALAGAATVAVGYLLADRLGGRRAAWIAGLLLAFSPLLIWFSQEARAYSLAALFATGTVLCLLRYLDTDSGRWLAGWAASAALGLCTHYFVVFVVAPEVGLLLWRRRTDARAVVGSGIVALVALALIPLALAQRGTGNADYIAQGSLTTRAAQVPKQFLVGYASPSQVLTAVVATVIILIGALWPLVRDCRQLDRTVPITLSIAVLAVLAPLVLALLGIDFLDTRNVLVALPALLCVAAVGFARPASWPRGAIMAGALVAVFAIVVARVDTDVRYQRSDWRGASDALGPVTGPRALVVTPGNGQLPLAVYQPHVTSLGTDRVRELDVVGIPSASTGSGIGAAPRPTVPFHVPPGFKLVHATYNRAYTVLRFRSPTAVTVTPATLGSSHLGGGGFATLLQTPSR